MANRELFAALIKGGETGVVFYSIQNLLNATANISKVLWGQRGKYAKPRKELRDILGVKDTSPLRATTIRNKFEHFDEYIDDWWENSQNHIFIDLNVVSDFEKDFNTSINDSDKFRNFEPWTTDVIWGGQRFNLRELVDEVERILPKVIEETKKFPLKERW